MSCIASTTQVGAIFGAVGAAVACIVFGASALVPAYPFETQQIATGVVLLVFGGTGVASVGGAAAGALFGALLGSPFDLLVWSFNHTTTKHPPPPPPASGSTAAPAAPATTTIMICNNA